VWEKEIRALSSSCTQKSKRIADLEQALKQTDLTRTELEFVLKSMEKEISLLNKALQMYGINADEINLEALKKVFEENQKLKEDISRLLSNIETSRQDLQQLSRQSSAQMTSTQIT